MKSFRLKHLLADAINDYFETRTVVNTIKKSTDPPTIGGLVLHLGFISKEEFDEYEAKGRFGYLLKQARYRVMVYYEQRLSYPSPMGAMFALKCLGWATTPEATITQTGPSSINIKLIETGPEPASSEKEVKL